MKISLNVLNHLGIHLYSNIPAVLSEVVANAWDADAEMVHIRIDTGNGKIIISDDGHGMNREDVNDKYLCVGYQRRAKEEGRVTPKLKRPVMGRKGIGKLSLFSIARNVEVQTIRDGTKSGFRMSLDEIEKQIKTEEGTYLPKPLLDDDLTILKGTEIVLTDLKKDLRLTSSFLRRRLARRFSVIGAEYKFRIQVNEDPITIKDRDYYGKLQFLWYYGEKGKKAGEEATKATSVEDRTGQTDDLSRAYGKVQGWIGTVEFPTNLRDENDNLNRISLMVRDKMAQENILDDFNEGRLFTKYLIGEIHADFLDLDEQDDIATSNRQRIAEDDPRYLSLKEFIKKELNHIADRWTDLRNREGTKKALQIPALKDWFETLDKKSRKQAEGLFGKINQMSVERAEDRKQLFKQGVLAFESLRLRDLLDELDRVTPENFPILAEVFNSLDEIEISLYGQIAWERVNVINKLRKDVEENALEKVLQQHLFDHLWLLDPSWERAAGEEEYMESTVKKEFDKLDAKQAKEMKITKEELAARRDIKYTTYARKHVVIELKRAARKVSTTELIDQIEDYRDALFKILESTDRANEPIEVICVVGTDLTDWTNPRKKAESVKTLAAKETRVVTYQRLIDSAYRAYSDYLKKHEDANRIQKLLQEIDRTDLAL
jgi:hypothetical protein